MRNIILLVIVIFLFTGCRSKKKIVENTDIKIEELISETISETVLKDIVTDSVAISETTTLITDNEDSINVDTANPEKEVTVTKEEKDGKTTWTGTNVKNIRISSNKNTTQIEDSTAVEKKIIDNTSTILDKEKTTEVIIDFSKDNKKIDIKSTSTWVSMGIGVTILFAVLLIIYLLYRKYKNKIL